MAKTKWSIVCRLLVCATSIAAAITMIYCREEINTSVSTFKLSNRYWGSFEFFKIMSFIGGIYSLFIIFLHDGSPLWRLVVALDMILNMLNAASLGAAVYTYILLRVGNSHVGWSAVCRVAVDFCMKLKGALIAGTIALTLNFLLMGYTINVMVDPLLHSVEARH